MDEFGNNRYSKSFSCESLFIERPSLKRKHNMTQMSNNVSINKDDIGYLVKCGELIKIVKEVGRENDKIITAAVKDLDENKQNINSSDFKSSVLKDCLNHLNNEDSIVEFSKWLNLVEKQLNTYCCCSFMSTTNSSISANNNSNNIENGWSDAILDHKSIQCELENIGRKFINAIKLNGSCVSKSLLGSEERRWNLLLLKSLEYSMIIEQFKSCPKHSYRDVCSDHLPATPPKRHKLNSKCCADSKADSIASMKSRRVQTTMIGTNLTERLDHLRDAKFEIIQKDIGYSSDADMSDACEAHQCPDYIISSKFTRKRHTRRRRSGVTRNRPWSIHSEWPDWDYYQPPPCLATDCKSSDDWNSYDDENVVRSLIEFGENYEFWIKNEDDAIIRASTPKKDPEISDELVDYFDEESRVNVMIKEEYMNKNGSEVNLAALANGVVVTADMKRVASAAVVGAEKNINAQELENLTSTKKKIKKTSSSYFIYLTLSVFIVLLSSMFAFLPPHYQKTFPKRPPPI